MELKEYVFWAFVISIIIFSAVNIKMYTLETKFDKFCTVQYNISEDCPCLRTKFNTSELTGKDIKNITFSFNLSAYN